VAHFHLWHIGSMRLGLIFRAILAWSLELEQDSNFSGVTNSEALWARDYLRSIYFKPYGKTFLSNIPVSCFFPFPLLWDKEHKLADCLEEGSGHAVFSILCITSWGFAYLKDSCFCPILGHTLEAHPGMCRLRLSEYTGQYDWVQRELAKPLDSMTNPCPPN
jgi:hypothetical protein